MLFLILEMTLLPLLLALSVLCNVHGDVRVPIIMAPFASLNLPSLQSFVDQNEGYYNKVTSYDVWQTPVGGGEISAFDVIAESTILTMFYDAFRLVDSGLLSIEILEHRNLFHCPVECYFVKDADVVAATSLTPNDLENVQSYKIRELHEMAVAAMEKKFCFNMTVLEQKLNLSSLRVITDEWFLFVPDIVVAAIECRAGRLNVTIEELAKLLRTNTTTLYSYNMNEIENIFFPAVDDLLAGKTT